MLFLSVSFFPELVPAASTDQTLDLTTHIVGYIAIAIFVIAYLFVMAEKFTHLRKSKPVIVAAGVIWAMIAYIYLQHDMPHAAETAIRHNLLEYSWLIRKGYSLKKIFRLTGILAFFMSPIADNLTTALLMCAVILAVGGKNTRFVSIACINIVVAANARGAFSPFGDIATLMVWQKGIVDFTTFLHESLQTASCSAIRNASNSSPTKPDFPGCIV